MSEAPTINRPPPTLRGGFIVHRRGDSAGRIRTPPARGLYEHASLESASAEAERLANKYGKEFAVFQEVAAALPPPPAAGMDVVLVRRATSLLQLMTASVQTASHALRSYENGNASPDLAKDIADHLDAVLAQAKDC